MSDGLKVAALATIYYPWSHADVLLDRWMVERASDRDWGWNGPRMKLASVYLEQRDARDVGVATCAKHGVPMYGSIREALMLGGDKLAVDGVLLIGEHGEYPFNEFRQKMFPRKEYFDQIVSVFEESGKVVPVFNDKHLSWNFDWAREMVATADRLGFMLLASSCLSVVPAVGPVGRVRGKVVEEAVAVTYGRLECYGYHSLEFVQSIIETRKGGETGVRAMTAYQGAEVWQALDAGAWSKELMEAAIAAAHGRKPGEYRRDMLDEKIGSPAAWVMEYADGLKVTHVNLSGWIEGNSAAFRLRGEKDIVAGEPRMDYSSATRYAHFATLARTIEDAFVSGVRPFKQERTLMTTGGTAAMMRSLAQRGVRMETRELGIVYDPNMR